MAVFEVQEKGLKKLLDRFEDLSENIQKELVMEIQATAFDIQGDARAAAPANYSQLRQSIRVRKVGSGAFLTAGAGVVYAPYVEWGTGALVSVPADLKEYAIQFKGKGIREVNTVARPYFFPALRKNMPLLLERIKKIINDT